MSHLHTGSLVAWNSTLVPSTSRHESQVLNMKSDGDDMFWRCVDTAHSQWHKQTWTYCICGLQKHPNIYSFLSFRCAHPKLYFSPHKSPAVGSELGPVKYLCSGCDRLKLWEPIFSSSSLSLISFTCPCSYFFSRLGLYPPSLSRSHAVPPSLALIDSSALAQFKTSWFDHGLWCWWTADLSCTDCGSRKHTRPYAQHDDRHTSDFCLFQRWKWIDFQLWTSSSFWYLWLVQHVVWSLCNLFMPANKEKL